jgi:hypothetical protein
MEVHPQHNRDNVFYGSVQKLQNYKTMNPVVGLDVATEESQVQAFLD